jgi:ribosomal protein S27E
MAERGRSVTQRLFTALVDEETAAAMEAHSRAWLVECPHCGHARSIWDLGGIRYKATGRPATYLRCPGCGKGGWHRVRKAADFPVTTAPLWPLIRLILLIGVVGTLAALLVAALILGLAEVVRG